MKLIYKKYIIDSLAPRCAEASPDEEVIDAIEYPINDSHLWATRWFNKRLLTLLGERWRRWDLGEPCW